MFENAIIGTDRRPSEARARPIYRRFVPAPRRPRGGWEKTKIRAVRSGAARPRGRAVRLVTWSATWRTVSSASLKKSRTKARAAEVVKAGERPDAVASHERRRIAWTPTARSDAMSRHFSRASARASIARRCTAGRGSPSNSTAALCAVASRRSPSRARASFPTDRPTCGAPGA